jgi:hypothetical protein
MASCSYNRTTVPRLRRALAVLCILVILAGALLAPVAGGAVSGVLVPLSALFGFVALLTISAGRVVPASSSLASPPLPSRAPPRQLSTI